MANSRAPLYHGARYENGRRVTKTFVSKYGPWALIAGASDGMGSAFAERLADRGLNVVLLSRRQAVLDQVAAGIERRTGVQTRTLAVDLSEPEAAKTIIARTADLDIGFLVYCAGADPNFQPFLPTPVAAAEAMVIRNCLIPVQLCHHFAAPMAQRGRGGIVMFGSVAGFVGAPNMVAYAAAKSFDMVFAEAMWSELHDKGVDVLGLILGKIDTPAQRRLEHKLGALPSTDIAPLNSAPIEDVLDEAFANLGNGPTWIVGEEMQATAQAMGAMTRSDAVRFFMQFTESAMSADG